MDFITELNSGIVVDRAGLNKLKTVDMAATLAETYAKNKPVVLVDNVKQFFGNTNLFRALEGNADGLDLILEQRGIELTQDQKDLVVNFNNLKAYIEDQIAALTPLPPPYPFAVVPDGWSVETHIKFQAKQIKRAQGNTDYAVGYKTLERIWDHAAAVWSGNSKDRNLSGIQAGGYWRDVRVHDNNVEIGCQRIQRYELEQVAVARGWAFPEVKSED